MNLQSKFKQNNIIASIAMVALLLFMPLAKAMHYADHDSTVHEVHCKTCSSSVLDDFDLPSPTLNIAIVDFKTIAFIHTSTHVVYPFTKAYLSRAPPINFY